MPRPEPLSPALSKWWLRAGMALPLLMLGANLLAWLRWGTDLPYLDDWRVYDDGSALSLDPRHLFRAVNNTISPVGLTLEDGSNTAATPPSRSWASFRPT